MDEEVNLDANIDINRALTEFQEKSKAEEARKNIKLEKDSDMPRMDRWVVKLSGGTIKDQRSAEWVLLTFVIVVIGISAVIFFFGIGQNQKVPPMTAEQRSYMQTGHGLETQ